MEDEFEAEFRSTVEESYGIPISANTSIILGLTKNFNKKYSKIIFRNGYAMER